MPPDTAALTRGCLRYSPAVVLAELRWRRLWSPNLPQAARSQLAPDAVSRIFFDTDGKDDLQGCSLRGLAPRRPFSGRKANAPAAGPAVRVRCRAISTPAPPFKLRTTDNHRRAAHRRRSLRVASQRRHRTLLDCRACGGPFLTDTRRAPGGHHPYVKSVFLQRFATETPQSSIVRGRDACCRHPRSLAERQGSHTSGSSGAA
jgi:hypothetical protein